MWIYEYIFMFRISLVSFLVIMCIQYGWFFKKFNSRFCFVIEMEVKKKLRSKLIKHDRLKQKRFIVSSNIIVFNVLTLNMTLTQTILHFYIFIKTFSLSHFPNGDCWLLPYIRFPFTLNSHFIQIIELCVYLCTR